jgi:hypothetical protein
MEISLNRNIDFEIEVLPNEELEFESYVFLNKPTSKNNFPLIKSYFPPIIKSDLSESSKSTISGLSSFKDLL